MRIRVLCAAVSTLLLIAAPAAAEVTVTTTGDTVALDGQCSLREAVAAADAHAPTADCPGVAGSGTTEVTLAEGTYVLSGGALPIGATGDIALTGQGSDPESGVPGTTLQATSTRLLTVASGGALSLSGLVLSGGRAPAGGDGGAILNAGRLEAFDVTIQDARAGHGAPGSDGGDGGAIFSSGPVSLTIVTITQVSAGDGGDGAAGAKGGDGGDGGAIFSSGPLSIQYADISEAETGRGGRGGDGDDGSGAPGGDGGVGGEGGAIVTDGAGLALDGSFVAGVHTSSGGEGGSGGDAATTPGDGGDGGAAGPGGAIALRGGSATISDSSIDTAQVYPAGAGGAAGTGGTVTAAAGADGGALGGGAVAVLDGDLTLTDSTIAGSNAGAGDGGGILATGDLTATNVTLARNHAGGRAGGVWSSGAGTVTLRHVTASGNDAGAGAAGTFEGVDTLAASIVAGGSSPRCVAVGGGDHNVAYPSADGCPGATAGDPRLSEHLEWNGGRAFTLVLEEGSAAIDVVPTAGCPAADERGYPRPQGAACDAGAVEAGGPPRCADQTVSTPYQTPVAVTLSCTTPDGPGGLGLGVQWPDHGTLDWTDPDSDTVIYTPDPGFSGIDVIQYYGWTDFGGFSDVAEVTVRVGARPGSVRPTPPPAAAGPSTVTPLLPNRPVTAAGTKRLPLLTIKDQQKGKAVKGVVNVATAGSRLDAKLTIKGKGKKAKPVVVGRASARRLPAGPYELTVKLDKKRGLAALRGRRSLKVVLTVTVTSASGAKVQKTKAITLTR